MVAVLIAAGIFASMVIYSLWMIRGAQMRWLTGEDSMCTQIFADSARIRLWLRRESFSTVFGTILEKQPAACFNRRHYFVLARKNWKKPQNQKFLL